MELNHQPESTLSSSLKLLDIGLVPYSQALDFQLQILERVQFNSVEEYIIFCSHPSVVTTGRRTDPTDIYAWDGEVIEIQRGGRATYHGPNQLVAYPIVSLDKRGRDIQKYIRLLEESVVLTLNEYEVEAEGRQDEATGVWVGRHKIASIGIGVKKWVTYHGIAINLDHDPKAFKGINPCGFSPDIMISLEGVLGRKINREHFKAILLKNLIYQLKPF